MFNFSVKNNTGYSKTMSMYYNM